MTEERVEELTPEPKPISFTIGKCKLVVVTDQDGKRHFEATCQSKEAREEMAAIFEQEAILRVNPKVILEDSPPVGE